MTLRGNPERSSHAFCCGSDHNRVPVDLGKGEEFRKLKLWFACCFYHCLFIPFLLVNRKNMFLRLERFKDPLVGQGTSVGVLEGNFGIGGFHVKSFEELEHANTYATRQFLSI